MGCSTCPVIGYIVQLENVTKAKGEYAASLKTMNVYFLKWKVEVHTFLITGLLLDRRMQE